MDNLARKIIGGVITSMPHNENYEELYDLKADQDDLDTLSEKLDGLAGVGHTTETVKSNADKIDNVTNQFNSHKQSVAQDISELQSVRIHKGKTAPIDTIFWLDTSV